MAISDAQGKYGSRFVFTFDVDVTSLWLGCFKFHTMKSVVARRVWGSLRSWTNVRMKR